MSSLHVLGNNSIISKVLTTMARLSVKLLLLLELWLWSTVLAASLHYTQHVSMWRDFRQTYNKTYDDVEEEFRRFLIWRENIRMILDHNVAADRGEHSFWLEVNHMADMTSAEIDSKYKGLDVEVELSEDIGTSKAQERLPAAVDWRQKGYVTPVKFQRHCGGCYAFSATGALEGQHFRRTGRLVSLSEQNIIDCTYHNKYHNKGCHGGLMDHAFDYITENDGIDTEASYPYEAEVGKCRFNKSTIGSTELGYMDILPRGHEGSLLAAVSQLGPVSVGVDARGPIFHFYKSGVYDNLGCSSRKLDHAMLVVGYGTDPSGKDYWIVKNSWDTNWGLGGYIHMARGKGNQCGIASLASIPQL